MRGWWNNRSMFLSLSPSSLLKKNQQIKKHTHEEQKWSHWWQRPTQVRRVRPQSEGPTPGHTRTEAFTRRCRGELCPRVAATKAPLEEHLTSATHGCGRWCLFPSVLVSASPRRRADRASAVGPREHMGGPCCVLPHASQRGSGWRKWR